MSLFVWDAKYSVNIREIDRQHQRLFDLFNELYEALQEGRGAAVIDKVLTSVLDYTVYHFSHEEQLFRTHGYPDLAAHCAEHLKLTEQAKTLAQKLRTGKSDVALATLKLLSDWLTHHVLVADQQFAPFLIARGVQ